LGAVFLQKTEVGERVVSKQSNAKKAERLGMPYGTACNRLKKMVMFNMAKELGIDICFKCRLPIEDLKEFSVEHKVPWIDQDPETFWDLNNVAFAHLGCNYTAARKDTPSCIAYQESRWPYPEGMAKCYFCSEIKSFDEFHKNKNNKRGIGFLCKSCVIEKRKQKCAGVTQLAE
jgi:hypothetical protein